MSGEVPPPVPPSEERAGPSAPPALDAAAATAAAISDIVARKIHEALANQANDNPAPVLPGPPPAPENTGATGADTTAVTAAVENPRAAGPPTANLAAQAAARAGGAAASLPAAEGQEQEPPEDPENEDPDSDDPNEALYGPQAFTPKWYEARRGAVVRPRFEVPARFEPSYPVGFEPESVAHFKTFCAPGTSTGRTKEAAGLYASAAYHTHASNTPTQAAEDLIESVEKIPDDADPEAVRTIRQAIVSVSDAQLCTFGVYELAASRYEVLAGKQGATGVADPEVLLAYIDAPAAYSSAGRQAFRRQQVQAIKYATQLAGRNRRRSPAEAVQQFWQPDATPRGNRSSSRGGGKGTGGGNRGRGRK